MTKHIAPVFKALTVAVLVAGVGSLQAQGPNASPTMVAPGGIVQVQASRLGSSVTLGGTVVAYKEVTLTAQVPGEIEYLAGKEGDTFNSGDMLLAINDDDLLAKRRAAVAQYQTAQAALSSAQVQYDREIHSPQSRSAYRSGGMGLPSMFDQMFTQPMTDMMPGNIGGDPYLDRQADLHTFGTRLSQAESALTAAQSAIEEIDAKLRDTRTFAPFDGVVVSKLVEQGDIVQPGQALMVFADLTYLQIEVDIPVRLVSGIERGMILPVKLDVGGVRMDGRVAQIFPTADAQRHTVKVKLDLPVGAPGGPGMYAEVQVPDNSAPGGDVPVIPDNAVVWRGSLPAVFVVGSNNQPQLRLVRLGDFVGPNQVTVLSGLQVGESIYLNPPPGMGSGWNPGETPNR